MKTTGLQTINIADFIKQCFGDKDYAQMTPAEILEAIKAQYKDVETPELWTNTELIAKIKEHISNRNLRAAFRILRALDSVKYPGSGFSGDRFTFFKKKGTLVGMTERDGLLTPEVVYGCNAGEYFFHVIVDYNGIGCYSQKKEVYALANQYSKNTDDITLMNFVKELDNLGKLNGKFIACFKTLSDCDKIIDQYLKKRDFEGLNAIAEKIKMAQWEAECNNEEKVKNNNDQQHKPLIYDNSYDQWKWNCRYSQKIMWVDDYEVIADLFLGFQEKTRA